jgi:hypothetical protein
MHGPREMSSLSKLRRASLGPYLVEFGYGIINVDLGSHFRSEPHFRSEFDLNAFVDDQRLDGII